MAAEHRINATQERAGSHIPSSPRHSLRVAHIRGERRAIVKRLLGVLNDRSRLIEGFDSDCRGGEQARRAPRDLIDDGSSVTSNSRTSQLAGAIVGGVLFGGVGAIVGGLTGKKNNARMIKELALHIVVNDRAKPLFVIDVLALRKAVARDKVKAQVLHTQKAQALIAGLIKTADDEDRAKEREQLVAIAAPKPAAPERLSFADEFMKLAKLRQEGALSEQEFTDLKAELIRRAKPVSA